MPGLHANAKLDVQKFLAGFMETLEDAGMTTHYKVAGANHGPYRFGQSQSQPHKVQVAWFPIAGKEFQLVIDLIELKKDPSEYLERTLDKINSCINDIKANKHEVVKH